MYDREAQRLYSKRWRDKNPDHYREYQREYHRKRYHQDIEGARARLRAKYHERKAKGIMPTPEQIETRRAREHAYYCAHRKEMCARARLRYAEQVLLKYGRIARSNKRCK